MGKVVEEVMYNETLLKNMVGSYPENCHKEDM